MDVAIVDTLWNGVGESVKIAALCDTFEVNCAAHNYHGWLGALARWKTNDNQRIIIPECAAFFLLMMEDDDHSASPRQARDKHKGS